MKKRTKNSRGRATRERIIDATIQVLAVDGLSGVTTQRLTEQVGMTQPGFYRHFSSTDECVIAAAERIGKRIREAIEKDRAMHNIGRPVGTIDDLAEHFDQMLRLIRREWQFFLLLQQYRLQTNPLGVALNQVYCGIHEDLVQHLQAGSAAAGIEGIAKPSYKRLADMILSTIFSVGTREAKRSVTIRKAAAKELSLMCYAASRAVYLGVIE
ncbi:MAG: TetR/AcrR family transcriptional regulator [Planctomycetota bacterium]